MVCVWWGGEGRRGELGLKWRGGGLEGLESWRQGREDGADG